MASPGFKKKLLISNDSPISWVELPAVSSSLSINGTMLEDTTYLSTGWKARLAGLRDFSCSGDLIYDSNVPSVQVLSNSLFTGSPVRFKYLVTDQDGITGTFFVEKFDMSGDVGNLDKANFSLQASGVPLAIISDIGLYFNIAKDSQYIPLMF